MTEITEVLQLSQCLETEIDWQIVKKYSSEYQETRYRQSILDQRINRIEYNLIFETTT